jgi:hypothetical protein
VAVLQSWFDLTVGKSSDIGEFSILERASSFAASWPLAVFLVGCEVKGDEEEEVGAEYSDTCEGGEFFSGALACVGHPGPVGGREVGVGCEVDEACILGQDLKTRGKK